LTLGAVTVTIAAAFLAAGLGRELRRAALLAVPVAFVIVLINAVVAGGQGLTVIVRVGQLPLLGHTDITLESTAYGGILGLRAAALILTGALYTAAVDPDDVLKLFRRVSFRSALTATIATRMVPVLLRDSRRLADAQRCRPGRPPSRVALMRATTSGVLDRALDVAAALEVRGYGSARRARRTHEPYSRHDLAFTASAASLLAVAIATRVADLAPFRAYPTLRAPLAAPGIAVAAAIVICGLVPFAQRRGIER
jgi:energy-coupling factor transport system permease protein